MRNLRADGQSALAAARRGLRHGDVVHAAGTQHRDRQQAHRSRTGDEHTVVRGDTGEVDGVKRDRRRLGECGGACVERIGHAQQAVRAHRLVTAERTTGEVEQVRWLAPQAHGRAAASARAALPAARRGVGDDARAYGPFTAIDVGAHVRDRAGPFVAEHRSGPGVALEDEVQVGAADPAVRHLDQRVAGPEHRDREVLHLDRAVADVHRGTHELLWHPHSFARWSAEDTTPEL